MDAILDKTDFSLLIPLALNNLKKKEIISLSLFFTLNCKKKKKMHANTKNGQKKASHDGHIPSLEKLI